MVTGGQHHHVVFLGDVRAFNAFVDERLAQTRALYPELTVSRRVAGARVTVEHLPGGLITWWRVGWRAAETLRGLSGTAELVVSAVVGREAYEAYPLVRHCVQIINAGSGYEYRESLW